MAKKNGNGKLKLIIGIVAIAAILIGVGIDYATISHGVQDNKEKNTSQDADMSAIVDSVDSNENRLDACEKIDERQTVLLEVIQKNQNKMDGKLDELLKR